MKEDFPISIRRGIKDDEAFIFSTWLRYFKHFSYFAKRIRYPVFFKWHHLLIERILARETTTILIATPKDDEDLIFGYLIYEEWDGKDVIHFAYVKGPYQRKRVGMKLLEHSKINTDTAFFSHWTQDTDELILKFPNLTYSPYHI